MADRNYTFLELTRSLCPQCLKLVDAKIIVKDDAVYMDKLCLEHGKSRVLVATDVEYYLRSRQTVKPGTLPKKFNTAVERGCPWDCGLCPDHEQHSCLTVVEITDRCNLTCPVCYAGSSPTAGPHRSLDHVKQMIDAIVANEGEPDVVQISGGEPTIHPQLFEILDYAKQQPIRHLMINTNGIRLAEDREFVARLAEYMPGFEVYFQWDSLQPEPYTQLRGANLLETKMKALDNLNEYNLSTTLVVTMKKGLNDHEVGAIVDFAAKQRCIRGVTLQPIQDAGRVENFNDTQRLTVSEVRSNVLEQSSLFTPKDIVPVPCHPDCVAMAYAIKTPKSGIRPISEFIDPALLLEESGNTIACERDPNIKEKVLNLFSTHHSPKSSAVSLTSLLCCLPKFALPFKIGYDNMFRLIVMQFLDAYSFDVRSVKRSCVHIVHPDLRIIPFDTYNMFYRPGLEVPKHART
ncbi:radical SAM protein [Planctomycetota bacterium]|nr:radical SAM protein [Planctomycetota bacterium]